MIGQAQRKGTLYDKGLKEVQGMQRVTLVLQATLPIALVLLYCYCADMCNSFGRSSRDILTIQERRNCAQRRYWKSHPVIKSKTLTCQSEALVYARLGGRSPSPQDHNILS